MDQAAQPAAVAATMYEAVNHGAIWLPLEPTHPLVSTL